MPKATVSKQHVRIELESCPGGYVILQMMSYGSTLERLDGASTIVVQGDAEEVDSTKMMLETMQTWARQFEFRTCIVDHNLEDDNGNKLDFANRLTFDILDPSVGREIQEAIDQLNGESGDKKMRDFTDAASLSSAAASELHKRDNSSEES